MKLQDKFNKALEQFVERHKKNKNVVGIFLTGSFVHSKPDKNSDLDVWVVLKNSKIRERGNTWINGVEVEYFMNPVKQVKVYFKEEAGEGGPHTAHMFANSKILFKRGNELDKLIKEAKKMMNKKRDKMKKIEKELARYGIDDIEKDLEDAYLNKDDFVFNQVALKALNNSLDIFLKITRTYEEKHKRLLPYLQKRDGKFANLYKNALLETNRKKKYVCLRKLIGYVEDKIDGKRPKEWKLRSKCTFLKE
jgi:predicted nucleotidyltransferase